MCHYGDVSLIAEERRYLSTASTVEVFTYFQLLLSMLLAGAEHWRRKKRRRERRRRSCGGSLNPQPMGGQMASHAVAGR